MKVLVVNTCGIAVGGITTNMLEYINALSDSNISFDILVTIYHEEDVILKFLNLGCKIINMPNRKKNPLGYAAKLNKLIKETRYDVIHVHGNSATMALELLIAKRNGIPIRIAHCHNNVCGHPFLHKILNPVFKSSYTTALACSQKAGEWIFGKENFQVLHNAINIEKYNFSEHVRTEYRKKLGIKDELVIGHVGTFNKQKNHEVVINVFAEIEKVTNAKLLLIGEGELRKEYIKKVHELGLKEKVLFLGIRNDVEKIMQAMDVFLFPSRWEGLGIVLVEAQAVGLPCIVSNVIPKEVKCTENIEYVNLNEGVSVWAHRVLNAFCGNRAEESKAACESLKKRGYCIGKEAWKLEKIYRGIF